MFEIKTLGLSNLADFNQLMANSHSAGNCFCMWWLISVKDYHANGADGNRQLFGDLVAASPGPLGLLAYAQGEAVGWCAVGPRQRFVRAINTPSFKGRDPADDQNTWLVPCFLVRPDRQKQGLTKLLLQAAIELARSHGARAIEGFPYCSGPKRRSGDTQVGFEPVFASLGFQVLRQTSSARVIMGLELS